MVSFAKRDLFYALDGRPLIRGERGYHSKQLNLVANSSAAGTVGKIVKNFRNVSVYFLLFLSII